ncbi:MAG: T9SS type A sorting domain-containing protein [Bacteroidota bacterium]
MKKLLLIALVAFSFKAQAQYTQTFENINLADLAADSGWAYSGVNIGNSNKLSGAQELITQLLNTSTSSTTFLTTYFYNATGSVSIQFEHVINNASGKDIDLIIRAINPGDTVVATYTFTYGSANKQVTTWTFPYTGKYKLNFVWSGAKVSSGSTAGLDMIIVNAPAIPLPVKLVSFNASLLSNAAQLNWATASEENVNRFEIYRSVDGKQFLPIGTVNATGNSNDLNEYAYYDVNATAVSKGTLYYKVKSIDNDGQSSWSSVSKVTTGSAVVTTVGLYPNPAVNTLNVNLNDLNASDVTIQIMDAFGKVVKSDINITNNNSFTVDVRNLESGIYIINMTNADGIATSIKFTKS